MTRQEKALTLFDNSFNCSQSVFASFADKVNLNEDICLRIATPFGGGMGRNQLTCGAVTGALMVLGNYYGKGKKDDENGKIESYQKVNEFFKMFREKHGHLSCLHLLEGLNFDNPDEMDQIKQRDMFNTHCRQFVSDAVKITEIITGIEKGT